MEGDWNVSDQIKHLANFNGNNAETLVKVISETTKCAQSVLKESEKLEKISKAVYRKLMQQNEHFIQHEWQKSCLHRY